MRHLVHALRAAVPVQPDAETARRWAREELADPAYRQGGKSILARLLEWLQERLDQMPSLGLPGATALAIAVGVLVVIALVVLWVAGPVRRRGTVRAARGALLDRDDARTAAQLRAAADVAASAGNWSLAVVERFRAVVRDLEERTVLDERPGRTADEAAHAAAAQLPALAADLRAGSALFDDVAYGHRDATADDDRRLRDLDDQVRAARRTRSAATAPAEVGS